MRGHAGLNQRFLSSWLTKGALNQPFVCGESFGFAWESRTEPYAENDHRNTANNCYTSESLEFNHPSMQHNIYWKTSYILETGCLPVTIHPLASEVLERQFLMVIIK